MQPLKFLPGYITYIFLYTFFFNKTFNKIMRSVVKLYYKRISLHLHAQYTIIKITKLYLF